MQDHFSFNDKLGIALPERPDQWHSFEEELQHDIILHWENIRGSIPDRIADLENTINVKLAMLNEEEDFAHSCQLNFEIAELASTINDLWIWFRTEEGVVQKKHM